MVTSEVQRTLVKSPPELWAEISDPESLARHLGEFGEIRITRVHPEQKVEWEADHASGSVAIKPSGWGTKVKLTVTRELTLAHDESDVEGAHDGEVVDCGEIVDVGAAEDGGDTAEDIDGAAGDQPKAETSAEIELTPGGEVDAGGATSPDAEAATELGEPDEGEPAPRRGFFARLLRRRRAARVVAPTESAPAASNAAEIVETVESSEREAPPAQAIESEVVASEPAEPIASRPEPTTESRAATEPESTSTADGSPSTSDITAELAAAEAVAAEEVAAVLGGVLDRLGAAHHRPFSRS